MKASAPNINEKPFTKAFGRGLLGVAAIYLAAFGYVALQADKTLHKLEETFPFRVVAIERPPEAYVYPPAPEHIATAQPQAQTVNPSETEQTPQVATPMGPLQAAPFDGLYETVKEGKLPKISEAGLTPFEAYKRPFSYQGNNVIAIAIRDYGLSASDSDAALALPPDVTLILSPYAENPDLWQKKAREAGHEVWLYLPMENARFLSEDPGPLAMMTHGSLPDNKRKLDMLLGSVTGYAGVVGETDKTFSDMHIMLEELVKSVFKRGLGYFEINIAGSELIETLAISASMPFSSFNQNAAVYTDKDLESLESTARQSGYVAAAVSLTPKNLEAIRTWTLGLSSRGTSLAPLSAIAAGRVPKKSQPRATGPVIGPVSTGETTVTPAPAPEATPAAPPPSE